VAAPGNQLVYPQRDYSGEFAFQYSGMEKHFIYTGVQFSYEDNLKNTSTVNGNTAILISDSNNSHATGFYLYDRWQVTNQFKVEGGLRVDQNSLLSEHARKYSGRFAIAHESPRENHTWITKLIANRAVRFPVPIAALNEAWGIDKPDASPGLRRSANADKPEILTTIEWQNILYINNTRLSANLYYQDLIDFISWNGPHTNVGDFSGTGLELELQHAFSKKLTLWANTSLIDSELKVSSTGGLTKNITSDGRILGSPKATVTTGLDADITSHFSVYSQIRYITKQAAFDKVKADDEDINNQVYVDQTISYAGLYNSKVSIGLTLQNILNNRDHINLQWQQNQYKPRGRTALFDARVSF